MLVSLYADYGTYSVLSPYLSVWLWLILRRGHWPPPPFLSEMELTATNLQPFAGTKKGCILMSSSNEFPSIYRNPACVGLGWGGGMHRKVLINWVSGGGWGPPPSSITNKKPLQTHTQHHQNICLINTLNARFGFLFMYVCILCIGGSAGLSHWGRRDG